MNQRFYILTYTHTHPYICQTQAGIKVCLTNALHTPLEEAPYKSNINQPYYLKIWNWAVNTETPRTAKTIKYRTAFLLLHFSKPQKLRAKIYAATIFILSNSLMGVIGYVLTNAMSVWGKKSGNTSTTITTTCRAGGNVLHWWRCLLWKMYFYRE